MIGPWEVTNKSTAPVMYYASDLDDLNEGAERRCIKALLKRAKLDDVSITAITVDVGEEGTTAVLVGTRDLTSS
jgi:hypothetical protein